jgi:Kef-type K+ transport system membrane component KefB/predicted amino acid-binding ACT domain protein
VSTVFLDILVVLVAAKLAAELAERLRIPTVVGEIAAGIAIGPSALGLVHDSDVLQTFAELGVILLLFEVGMQMDLRELGAVGRAALSVAVVGVVVPLAAGYPVARGFGLSSDESLFVAAALTATSVGITARVFGDLRALATTEARTVLGAAVADDVLGLVILTVVVRLITGEGSLDVVSVGGIVAVAVGFLVVCTAVGIAVIPGLFAGIERLARSSATLFALALALALAVAELASLAKLAPIIGAFVAGLALGRSRPAARIQRELTPVGHLFIPVFFLEIGIQTDVAQFRRWDVLGLAAVLITVAILGKIVAGVGARGVAADRLLVGLGMIPRGEVGLIFASIGLAEGVIGRDSYAAILLMVLVTTVITPPLLTWRTRAVARAATPAGGPAGALVAEPADGWLAALPPPGRAARPVLDLAAAPPASRALDIAFDAAARLVDHDPGPALVAYLRGVATASGSETGPLPWTHEATRRLVGVLRTGNSRSWRFLETTGVLERALPELHEAIGRRRLDPSLLDGGSVHHWKLVEQVRDLLDAPAEGRATHDGVVAIVRPAAERLQHPDRLLLAAWLIDALGDASDPSTAGAARSLLERLELDADEAAAIGRLVAERDLLAAGAVRRDGLGMDAVTALAVHLGSPEQADALLVLTLAGEELEDWERLLVEELHRLLLEAMAMPDLAGPAGRTRSILDRHRSDAMALAGPRNPVNERIAIAPVAYLLSQDPESIVRQVSLIEPVPTRGRFRVAVTPVPGDDRSWRVEVGGRDTIGLVAMVTGVLERYGLDVQDAVIATWGDKGALQVFRVEQSRGSVMPSAGELRAAVERSTPRSLESAGVPDATVSFDDSASPWHTIAEVRATDRPGLLHALAVAFAAAGVDVHAARVTTTDELALDRFDLTDRAGRKLTDEHKAAIRRHISDGVIARSIGSGPLQPVNRVVTNRKQRGSRRETSHS